MNSFCFAAGSAPPAHRTHEKAARAVLASLLPDPGTRIRSRQRSRGELRKVSGYSRAEDFRDLLDILDKELRLITPTLPFL